MSADSVFRIEWLPGTDVLDGRCHCGARHTCEEPVAMWEWLLAHPEHPATPTSPSAPSALDKDPAP